MLKNHSCFAGSEFCRIFAPDIKTSLNNPYEKAAFITSIGSSVSAIISGTICPGQNTLYEITNVDIKNSIIRYYDREDAYVIYTDNGAVRAFVFFQPSTSTTIMADFSAADVVVNDMKIVHGTLYFCGKQAYNNAAAFGHFDIMPVFFSSGQINISYSGSYTAIHPYANIISEHLTEFLQMEVQEISGRDVHIYMTANAYYTDTNGALGNDYRCVVDVWETGSTGGMASSQEEYWGDYYFNDLVIVDTSLVVVGDKHGATGQYMHRYTLPAAMTPSIFTSAPLSMPYWFAHDNQYYPKPEVRVAHIVGPYFAVACYGVIQSDSYGLVVSIYKGPGNLVERILIDDPYDTKKIRVLSADTTRKKGNCT